MRPHAKECIGINSGASEAIGLRVCVKWEIVEVWNDAAIPYMDACSMSLGLPTALCWVFLSLSAL